MPAQGPRGTIAAGATTTTLTLTTALPATVGVNQLANRGDGRGFKIRVIGNAGGSSGKIEERLVIANTAGTTPTLVLDSPLSFAPILGDAYEFLSGRIFLLGSTNVSATSFKFYDILTGFVSAGLSVANLPASWTESNLVGLDELLVPYDRNPGEGFFGTLTATASAAASLTGQAVGGDAGVVANQYRNFQIRIIQDTAIPTAVGQRRNITSHTAGPSPVYTVPAWAVIPSATAQYVIENNGDRIIGWFTGSTNTNTYTISTNAWDVAGTIFANRTGGAPTIGFCSHQSFSIELDAASPPNARHSFIFSINGAAIDLFDIAGAATGTWTNNITYGNPFTTTFLGGNGGESVQDPSTNQGRYFYINAQSIFSTGQQLFFRFDMKNRVLEQYTTLKFQTPTTSGTNPIRMIGITVFIDGNTKLSFLVRQTTGTTVVFGLPITR